MKFTRYISRKALQLVPLVAAALLCGCADDLEMPEIADAVDADTQLVIDLAIPFGEQVPAPQTLSRGEYDDPIGPDIDDPTMAPTVNELAMTNLRLYIFPYNAAGNKAPDLNLQLVAPDGDDIENGATVSRRYQVKGLKENVDYQVYLIANFPHSIADDFQSMSALENQTVEYSNNPVNLVAGRLPMVYKAKQLIRITSEDKGNPMEIAAAMQYACVKLRYSIIFDRDYVSPDGKRTKDAFGESSFLKPTSLKLQNAGNKMRIGWFPDDYDFYQNAQNASDRPLSLTNSIYSQFTVTDDNADQSNKYVVNNVANRIAASAIDADTRWVIHGTTYLPERYVNDVAKQTTLYMESDLNGAGIGCKHSQAIGLEAEDYKKLQRSFCYEFVGHIVNTNAEGIVWTCYEHEWLDETIRADFIHTYLTLDTAEVWVDTETDGEITYSTDGRGNLGFDCDDEFKVNGKNIFRLGAATTATERKLIIEPNPYVTIAELEAAGKAEGSVRCYIIAGNIKKYITVNYRLQGYFEVTPSNIKIQDGDNSTDADHVFEYNTNLGDFTITSENITTWLLKSSSTTATEHKFAESSFKLKIDGDNSSGKIYITEVNYPTTTEIHSFIFTPDNTLYASYATSASVDVMSSKDKYRVYFRAINDYQSSDDDMNWDVPEEFTGTGLNNLNWKDYWSTSTSPVPGNHMLYAYTQVGEEPLTMPVWEYTGAYGKDTEMTYEKSNTDVENLDETLYGKRNNNMKGDASNPGWYYYDIPVFCQGIYNEKGNPTVEEEQKYGNGPLPGATLLIFHNDGTSGTRHRVMQNEDPGIPLGDDNDNETWVLYDPSRDPVYNVYNDKPRIVNSTYTIYSDTEFAGWQNTYGTGNYKICGNLNDVSPTLNEAERTAGYIYKYTVVFKTPVNEYDKNIKLVEPGAVRGPQVAIGLYGSWDAEGAPFALFKSENTAGTATNELYVEMTQIPNKEKEYFCPVPQEFWGKWVAFCNHSKSSGFKNWKLFSVPVSGAIFMITYTDNDENEWQDKSGQYQTVISSDGSEVVLMGGANMRTGYFKNNHWYRTMQN